MTYRRRRQRTGRRKRNGCIFGLAAFVILCAGAATGIPWAVATFGGNVTETFHENVENAVHVLEAESPEEPESAVPEEEVAGGFYYQQLDEKNRLIYRELLYGLREMETTIRLDADRDDLPEKVYEAILYDCPELFWCLGSCQMTVYRDYTEFYPAYICSEADREQRSAEIEAAASECLSGIPADASEYDKIRIVFEYLVNTVDYDENAQDNQNIYSALVRKRSVCAGYSRAVQYLLDRLGIECIYVVGTAQDQEAHAWNIVKCDGRYYHVDATFGDPVFLGAESGEDLPPDIIYYDYLCCTDEQILADHTPMDGVPYPSCTSDDLNYYRMQGMYYDTYDPQVILNAMNDSISAGNDTFTCKFSSSEAYGQARDGLIGELFPEAARTVGRQHGLDQVKYTYIEDAAHNKIIVFWNYQ